MTVIVYRDGILAADGSSVSVIAPRVVAPYEKIHIAENKTLAFAVTGKVVSPENRKQLEGIFLDAIYSALKDVHGEALILKENAKLLENRSALIVTRDHVFRATGIELHNLPKALQELNGDSPAIQLAQFPADEHEAIGSGRNLANTALVAGLSAAEAVEFCIKFDYLCFPVGKTQVLHRNKLKALPKEIGHG